MINRKRHFASSTSPVGCLTSLEIRTQVASHWLVVIACPAHPKSGRVINSGPHHLPPSRGTRNIPGCTVQLLRLSQLTELVDSSPDVASLIKQSHF